MWLELAKNEQAKDNQEEVGNVEVEKKESQNAGCSTGASVGPEPTYESCAGGAAGAERAGAGGARKKKQRRFTDR